VTACSLVEGQERQHVSSKCLCVSTKLHSVGNAVVIRNVRGAARPGPGNVTVILPTEPCVRIVWEIGA